MNPSFGTLGFDFVIADQSAMLHKPSEGSFDNPPFGKDGEASRMYAGDDLQLECAAATVRGHPSLKFFSLVALVGPNTPQPTEPSERPGQEGSRARPFGNIGWGHTNPQQEAQGIDQDVAFAPLGILGTIVSAGSESVPAMGEMKGFKMYHFERGNRAPLSGRKGRQWSDGRKWVVGSGLNVRFWRIAGGFSARVKRTTIDLLVAAIIPNAIQG